MTSSLESLYIDGSWRPASGPSLESLDPANGSRLWSGASASEGDVDAAVLAARNAFAPWAALQTEDRLARLRAFAAALKERLPAMAETISKETGKPLWESKGEVSSMISKVDISAEAQQARSGCTRQEHPLGSLAIRHRPHGVVAVFGPFNFPGHLPHGHIIPALLAGNTVVFKPSEHTPLIAEAIMRCWEKASLPSGVVNMVQGAKETGRLLAEHPDIDGLFFTGSFATGKKLSELFSVRPQKILALEMGGNNPLVVGSISDVQAAAYTIVQSAYLTSGQRCTCARRLILLQELARPLIEALSAMIGKIKVGAYTDIPEPFMGPVISSETAEYLLECQQKLVSNGAIPIVEMKSLKRGTGFLSPGLVDISSCKSLADEEIFGPLLQVVVVETFADAIREAKKTSYGLAAGLLSDREDQYHEFRSQIRAGIINWNTPLTGASSSAPFGGIGRSGNHRPSAYYAADYCNYPVASIEAPALQLPTAATPYQTFF